MDDAVGDQESAANELLEWLVQNASNAYMRGLIRAFAPAVLERLSKITKDEACELARFLELHSPDLTRAIVGRALTRDPCWGKS